MKIRNFLLNEKVKAPFKKAERSKSDPKYPAWWTDLSFNAQKEYLQTHKGTDKKVTKKAGEAGKELSGKEKEPGESKVKKAVGGGDKGQGELEAKKKENDEKEAKIKQIEKEKGLKPGQVPKEEPEEEKPSKVKKALEKEVPGGEKNVKSGKGTEQEQRGETTKSKSDKEAGSNDQKAGAIKGNAETKGNVKPSKVKTAVGKPKYETEERIIKGKNKTLVKVDTAKEKEYTRNLKESNKEFTERNNNFSGKNLNMPGKPYVFPKMACIEKGKIPKRYAQIFERLMNTKTEGGVTFSHILGPDTGRAPKGAEASLPGELMSLMATCMNDTEVAEFQRGVEQKLDERGEGNHGFIDRSWLIAAVKNREANHKRWKYDNKGFDPDKDIIAGAWDFPEDLEAIGLQNPLSNVEDTADVFYKIKTKEGVRLEEVSLKKSADAKLKTGGLGELKKWDEKLNKKFDQTEFINKKKAKVRDYLLKHQKEVKKAMEKDEDVKAHMEKEGLEFDDITNPKNRPIMKGAILAIRALKDKNAEKFLEGIAQDERDFRLPCYEELAKNPKLKKGLMKKITDELPIASALDGSEPMVVGDISFDKNTSKEIFGTSNWNEITERLVLIHSERLPYIGYQTKTKKEVIPISKLEIIGHGSGTVNFDLMMHIDKRFANKMKEADEKIYGKAKKESIELNNLLNRLILEEEEKDDWAEILKPTVKEPSKFRTILETK
jgi:hypothetical protein